MTISRLSFACVVLVGLLTTCTRQNQEQQSVTNLVRVWVTSSDRSLQLQEQSIEAPAEMPVLRVNVDTAQAYQTMDGFGYALTGGSAMLLRTKLDSSHRANLLRELFGNEADAIGVSYLRISVGASDLDDHVFSYSEKKDPTLKNFTIAEDRQHLIPVLKEILAIQPSIKVMASPWSAPSWMKDNQLPKGGALMKEHYPTYARYLTLYIQAMADEGISIDALTLQNEPENPNNTPSLVMTAEEQADFVKNHLGPLFETEGIKTRIVVFDHNCDHPEYPIAILNDPGAKKYIDGSAFHMYLGEITAMSKVHDAHPDKNLYFTEQWTSGEGDFGGDLQWHVKNLMIGAPRNWSRNVLEWNLAADPQFNPHTNDGGCTLCQGALTIGDSVQRNVSYYIIAHASKFVKPGAKRIYSDYPETLPNVAYQNPDGGKVVLVLNETDQPQSFLLAQGKNTFTLRLDAHRVATITWP